MKRILVTTAAALSVLAGCSSTPMKPEDCARIGWYDEGLRAALNGQPRESAWQRRGGQCLAIGGVVDRAPFDAGWAEGQARYCTPPTALRSGRRNQHVGPICDPQRLAELNIAWNHGRLLRDADRQVEQRDAELRRAQARAEDPALTRAERMVALATIAGLINARQQAIDARRDLEAQANAYGWGIGR